MNLGRVWNAYTISNSHCITISLQQLECSLVKNQYIHNGKLQYLGVP